MADWLPDEWQVENGGSKSEVSQLTLFDKSGFTEYYFNKETGQTFPTKEAVLRYVNYLRNYGPNVPSFKQHFMDDTRTIFVERPWEKDTKHTMHDYFHGVVGKCKGMTPESSFATATNAETREDQEQKIKGLIDPNLENPEGLEKKPKLICYRRKRYRHDKFRKSAEPSQGIEQTGAQVLLESPSSNQPTDVLTPYYPQEASDITINLPTHIPCEAEAFLHDDEFIDYFINSQPPFLYSRF